MNIKLEWMGDVIYNRPPMVAQATPSFPWHFVRTNPPVPNPDSRPTLRSGLWLGIRPKRANARSSCGACWMLIKRYNREKGMGRTMGGGGVSVGRDPHRGGFKDV